MHAFGLVLAGKRAQHLPKPALSPRPAGLAVTRVHTWTLCLHIMTMYMLILLEQNISCRIMACDLIFG